MNNQFLKQQVDDFFSSTHKSRFAGWRQFKSQLKSKLSSTATDLNKPLLKKFKSSPIIYAKENITKIFQLKSPEPEPSLDSISEIPFKGENATISLQTTSLSELLTIHHIASIKQSLKSPLHESDQYIKELKSLADDINTALKQKS